MAAMNKYHFYLLFGLYCCCSILRAQTTIATLPHKEYRPYFKFRTFPKKVNESHIHQSLDYLQDKPSMQWNHSDSIQFMLDLSLLGDYYSSYQLFLELQLQGLDSLNEYHIVQHLLLQKGKKSKLFEWYEKEKEFTPSNAKNIEIRKRIDAALFLIHENKWSFKDSTLFSELKDPKWKYLKKGSFQYKSELIALLNIYDTALRIKVQLQNGENRALSMAYVELGNFIAAHVDLTDAYIAYFCARFYSRKSMYVAKKLKSVKEEIMDKNLLLPSLRDIFPQEKKGIFNYAILKEKRQQHILDSIKAAHIVPLKVEPIKKKNLLPMLNKDMLLLLGLSLILFCVIVFVKVKRK
jgi:hypothetical protein